MCSSIDSFLCCIRLRTGAILISIFNVLTGFAWLGYLIHTLVKQDEVMREAMASDTDVQIADILGHEPGNVGKTMNNVIDRLTEDVSTDHPSVAFGEAWKLWLTLYHWQLWYLLALCIVTIILAFILFIGVIKKNRVIVGVWEVFNIIVIAMNALFICYTLMIFLSPSTTAFVAAVNIVVFVLVVVSIYNAIVVHSYAVKELTPDDTNIVGPSAKSGFQ